MTIDEIRELINLATETGIAELEVQRGDNRVRIRRATADFESGGLARRPSSVSAGQTSLLANPTAFKRDVDDPKTIADFVATRLAGGAGEAGPGTVLGRVADDAGGLVQHDQAGAVRDDPGFEFLGCDAPTPRLSGHTTQVTWPNSWPDWRTAQPRRFRL